MRIKSAFSKICLVFILMVGGVASSKADQNDDYSSGVIPSSSRPFPEQFKDYQILPTSISPDKQYALIYPKRSVLYDLEEFSLYLVALNPFRILTIIPLYWTNLTRNSHGSYEVKWSKDSSAVIVVEGSKWGPSKSFLVTIRKGYASSITDLTDHIRFEVIDGFWKSKAEPFNAAFDILFSGVNEMDFLNSNQIQINYECTSDPKSLKKRPWDVRFEGVWDIPKGVFTSKRIIPVPPISPEPSQK
jgi:hypothetical protein